MMLLTVVGLAWVLVALPVALVTGRAIREAEQSEGAGGWTHEVEPVLAAGGRTLVSPSGPGHPLG